MIRKIKERNRKKKINRNIWNKKNIRKKKKNRKKQNNRLWERIKKVLLKQEMEIKCGHVLNAKEHHFQLELNIGLILKVNGIL